MAKKRTIVQRGEPIILDEDAAGAAITPGMILMYDGSGNLVKNTAAAANVARNFALERSEMGNDIDDDYATGDQVKVGAFCGGQHALALIASGANVAKGDYLTTDNAGRLTKTSVAATIRVAQATESVNNTAGPADARIIVQVV